MNRLQKDTDSLGMIRLVVVLASLVVIIYGLSFATSVLTTIFLAFIIAVCASPLMTWLRRRGLPTWLAFVIVCLVVVAFMLGVVLIMFISIERFINTLPTYTDRVAELRQILRDRLDSYGIATDQINSVIDLKTFKPENMVNFFVSIASSIASQLSNWGFILFVAALMLLESVSQPEKLKKAVHAESLMPKRFSEFNKDIRSYIKLNAWLGLVAAICNTILLYILGVDFALLWGLLSFFFSFIPIVGFILSFIPPMLLALLQFGIGHAIIVVAGYIIINLIVDNVINPRVMSRGLNLSPLMVILSLLFWSWIMGPLGAILAVPLTLAVKELVLEASDETSWLAALMEPGGSSQLIEEEEPA